MSFLDILKALVPLIFIVGLLYGVLIFVRKYGVSFRGKKSNLISIKVLSSQMLMPKKYISVVKVEDKVLVLGVSENSISLLKELDSKIDDLDANNFTEENDQSFFNILKKNIGLK